MNLRLPLRLFVSYTLVAVVGAAVSYLTVRLLAPRLFDQRMGMMDDSSRMMTGGTAPGVHSAFSSALNTALVVGVLSSIAVAAGIAALVTRRLLRPLDAVRAATRRIAAGHYDSSVSLPSEPELAELATDVNALADALAATEGRRTRLLGEVAHEMRTPLTSLDGYVEGMIDGVFAADQATLASLSAELRRLHRLADDLSSLSRAEEKRLELTRSDEDLAEIVRRAVARLAPQFQDAQIALDVTAAEAVPVHVDPDRSTQVLTNLLGNAREAPLAGPRSRSPTPVWAWSVTTSSGSSSASTARRGNRADPPDRASDSPSRGVSHAPMVETSTRRRQVRARARGSRSPCPGATDPTRGQQRGSDAPASGIAKDFGISRDALGNWMEKANVEDGHRPGLSAADRKELRKATGVKCVVGSGTLEWSCWV